MRMISLIALGVPGPARHHLIDRRLTFFILVTSPASQAKAGPAHRQQAKDFYPGVSPRDLNSLVAGKEAAAAP